MNEAETRAELIDPLLTAAGWGVVEGSRTRREFSITPRRIEGGRRGKPLTAEDVLTGRITQLAVVEAKPDSAPLTEGVAQAKDDAGKLRLRFTYASNGLGVYAINIASGEEGPMATFPSPTELWARNFAEDNAWPDRFAAFPDADSGGSWQIRFYQDKDDFTILDFVKADQHFSDPEWDGEPPEPQEINLRIPGLNPDPKHDDAPKGGDEPDEQTRRTKLRIKLGDGKERSIQHMLITTSGIPTASR